MPTYIFLLAGALALAATGCNSDIHRSVVTGPLQAQSVPVGPPPGDGQVTPVANPLANDPVALQDGRRLFNWYNCSGCHGGHGGGGMGPSLRDPVWLYGDRPDQIFDSIAQGRSEGMPAWGSKIPQQQIWELVTYLKSMGTLQEPDPPVEPASELVYNPSHNDVPAQGVKSPR